MIHGVCAGEYGQGGARRQKWDRGFFHRRDRVFRVDGGDGFVAEGEGLFQVLKDLILGLNGIRAV